MQILPLAGKVLIRLNLTDAEAGCHPGLQSPQKSSRCCVRASARSGPIGSFSFFSVLAPAVAVPKKLSSATAARRVGARRFWPGSIYCRCSLSPREQFYPPFCSRWLLCGPKWGWERLSQGSSPGMCRTRYPARYTHDGRAPPRESRRISDFLRTLRLFTVSKSVFVFPMSGKL